MNETPAERIRSLLGRARSAKSGATPAARGLEDVFANPLAALDTAAPGDPEPTPVPEPATIPRPPAALSIRDFTYSSSDGLALHATVYGDAQPWLPVVCLPGLSRTARDFHDLGVRLSTDPDRPRRVVAFDYRGRGRSAWDKQTSRYNPITEMNDVLDGMAALDVARAVVIGTSRGGIIAMLMAVARPTILAGIVLNDVGPELEARGLARIKSYIGRTPRPDDWADAARILKRLHGTQFTALNDSDWEAFARTTYRDENGSPAADYDPDLALTLDGIDFDRPMPTLWNEFRALRALPVLAIRGENSDLLTPATLAAMEAEHPGLEAFVVPGEGHPPRLSPRPVLDRIAAFLTRVEGPTPPLDALMPTPPRADDLDHAGPG